jgi:hypothetical protein
LTKAPKFTIGSPMPADPPKLFSLSRDSNLNIQAIKKYGTVVTYENGETVFTENDIGDCLYIVLKGKVLVQTKSAGVISELTAGDLFGEMSVIDGIERSATVITTEKTMLFLISNEQFPSAIGAEPNLAIKIMNTMSSRIRVCNKRIGHEDRSQVLKEEFKILLSEEFLCDIDDEDSDEGAVSCNIEHSKNIQNHDSSEQMGFIVK